MRVRAPGDARRTVRAGRHAPYAFSAWVPDENWPTRLGPKVSTRRTTALKILTVQTASSSSACVQNVALSLRPGPLRRRR